MHCTALNTSTTAQSPSIGYRLSTIGYSRAATTAIYIEALQSDENPYAEALVSELGLEG